MNVDKNVYGWTYCLLKYGDVYLRLYRESDYTDPVFKQDKINNAFTARTSLNEALNQDMPEIKDKDKLDEAINLSVHTADDHYSYYVEMVPDPGTMFELTKYGKTYGYIEVPNSDNGMGTDTSQTWAGITSSANAFNFKMKSSDVNVYQADDFAHACLEDNFTRFPDKVDLFIEDTSETKTKGPSTGYSYQVRRGKSILYDSYKLWREKALLENAALLNRITRSSMLRKVSVEVGDMPKEQVQLTLRRVKEMMEQKTAISAGGSFAEYQNPGPVENNIYFATHGGQGAITVEAIGGDVEVKNLADLDYWNNKFYSSYGIPKQYFGWTDDGAGFNGGTSLTILSSVYAKGVKRVQNAIIQAVTDIVNLFLLSNGCKSYLNNFVIKMQAPATQEEVDFRAALTNKITAISNLQGLFTDVEDKARRLKILKTLISSLNVGDEVVAELDDEIEAIKAAAEAEAKAAEEEAALAAGETSASDMDTVAESEPEAEASDADTDLTPMPESFETEDESLATLHEDDEFAGILNEDEDLKSGEELGVDFTENK